MFDLPVNDVLPALIESLGHAPNAVLVAPPGAGKTTTVPLALMQAGYGKILLLEPRRLAARAAATRMAYLLGESVGQRVGFRTRLESAVSSATVIEVITEGLLASRLLADPGLEGVACVIFDEVHERSLEADLALAMVLDLQRGLRPELRVLAMSATADAGPLAALLDAPVIESDGRMHAVSVQHTARDIPTVRELPEAAAKAIREILVAHEGDVLVFLPGMAEIRRTQSALEGCPALVLPLHGDLTPEAQDLALRQHEKRRVVLATSIAETSLTVPGVRIVVDGGFRRSPRLDVSSGLTRLATMRISRAAATQRSGRAGREAPGVAVRLWSEALHRGLAPFERAEIFEAELSGLVLACAAWGERPEALPFPDAPPAGAVKAARGLLQDLGALDEAERLTPLGREMAKLRATPRLAAMMCAAKSPPEKALAADLAALLEERDPLARSGDAPVDVMLRLEALAGRGEGASHADRAALARIRQAGGIYRARLGLARHAIAAGDAGGLLAAAFVDRVGQSRGEPGSYRLAGGGSGNVNPTDPMARNKLIVVAALDAKGSKVKLAAKLDADDLPGPLRARLKSTRETAFDPATGGVMTRERLRLGSLVLSDKSSPPAPAEAQAALAKAVAARLDILDWSDAVLNLQARAAVMRGIDPDFPDISREALAARTDVWLAPYLAGMSHIREVKNLDLVDILRNFLGYETARALDKALPVSLEFPNGSVRVDYTGPVPVASARAKFFYGVDATPKLAGGRVALQIALLSPAGRPIAITGDLASFWRNGWVDARRDMRGRYPKHDWPEEPWK
ncbi:MAG: ATP-dependent helicase HrpB [Acidocella sp. 20-57-95]|nr:MAG: ATP-dependent helicase HrpB [Acidocella sp. 20-57-95]OYV62016.1 MAG: ATP-dependent helicase HrpB [Acidocella sp. 21-58-7]HQT64266.1 ATP-dependent helicase HrpB [Acidocella sp.]HQU04618.1 ATP-dependent helicase HrpB [Acidocella sp.]